MTTKALEAAVRSAATIILSQNETMTAEQAETLARNVMTAAGVDFTATDTPAAPAPRPVAPKLDSAAIANASAAERSAAFRAHEKAMEAWLPTMASYEEPLSDVAVAARARLQELRVQSDNDSDAVKAQRAMEREALMQTIIAGGGARL